MMIQSDLIIIMANCSLIPNRNQGVLIHKISSKLLIGQNEPFCKLSRIITERYVLEMKYI